MWDLWFQLFVLFSIPAIAICVAVSSSANCISMLGSPIRCRAAHILSHPSDGSVILVDAQHSRSQRACLCASSESALHCNSDKTHTQHIMHHLSKSKLISISITPICSRGLNRHRHHFQYLCRCLCLRVPMSIGITSVIACFWQSQYRYK